jgi:hypothetical protein
MKTLCIVACHSDSPLKIKAIKQNHHFLMEITDDIIYVNSEECKEEIELPMRYIKNDEGLCYSKYLHVLSSIDLFKYDNFILTNDSIFIKRSLLDYKNLFLYNVEMSSIVASNQIKFHYPDFLRRYNRTGIQKIISFLKEKLVHTYTYDELIHNIEIQYHTLHDTINVLYPSIPYYYGNIHYDDEKIKEYIILNYPIIKIKKIMSQLKEYESVIQSKSKMSYVKNKRIIFSLNKL